MAIPGGVRCALVLLVLLGASLAARAQGEQRVPPLVVSSIRPLHLMLRALTGDSVEARVLLEAGVSPHDFVLRPSQLRLLSAARQVFWFDATLEHPLPAVFARLPAPRRDTALLPLIAPPARGDGYVDPHVWLDPRLAAVTAVAMARVLEERGLVSAAVITPRLQAFQDEMARVEEDIAAQFRGLEAVPFVAMHDGYAYFVQRFGLRQAAVLALDAEQQVGARALSRMRREMQDSGAVCLLRERSGDNARLAQMIIEGRAMRVAELDSLASDAPDDAGGYALFLEDFARAVAVCLRGPAS
ncbi:MAG: zinc ABC transporter substrate-binding protein [Pseudomonadales bacterium]|jgi:zinc transport system substrate-binding protein|nr:zinc ABC transporter substrate-binding protein [Pseudomonadales bacterium]MBP9032884.1 zinc ABC transporter substrate-binding protein [Pseudomonadales bacterium]